MVAIYNGLIDLTSGYVGMGFCEEVLYALEWCLDSDISPNKLVATQRDCDREKVLEITRLIQAAIVLPLVTVVAYQDSYYIVDGHHRAVAYIDLGRDVPCEVFSPDYSYGEFFNGVQ